MAEPVQPLTTAVWEFPTTEDEEDVKQFKDQHVTGMETYAHMMHMYTHIYIYIHIDTETDLLYICNMYMYIHVYNVYIKYRCMRYRQYADTFACL